MDAPALLLLGVGEVGLTIARMERGARRVIGTTRQPERIFELFHEEIEPIVMPWPSAEVIAPLAKGADVVVSFPPDGSTDAVLAPACLESKSIVYVSSTVVYGMEAGTIDDTTPTAEDNQPARLRIEAERIWRSLDANVLRAPAIYGPSRGLHRRLQDGSYRLPGDGTRISSRIHVDDLCTLILAVLNAGLKQQTWVVGDALPTSHNEVVSWLCDKLHLDKPPSVPLEEVHYTQRANRKIDGSRILQELGVRLKYPTYKEGFTACLDQPRET